nr:recombinase family protein [Ktedonobacter racemifer]
MRQEQCARTFTDKMTGKRFDRPEFLRMLDIAREGDVIVVWRLDRLGRSLKDLMACQCETDEKIPGLCTFLLKSLFDLCQYTARNSSVRCARKGGFFQCSHILLRAF